MDFENHIFLIWS